MSQPGPEIWPGGQPVVELGDRPPAEHRGEAQELALDLGDRHPQDRLALLAELTALGNVTQLVEVEVGAAQHAGEPLPGDPVLGRIDLEACQRQR